MNKLIVAILSKQIINLSCSCFPYILRGPYDWLPSLFCCHTLYSFSFYQYRLFARYNLSLSHTQSCLVLFHIMLYTAKYSMHNKHPFIITLKWHFPSCNLIPANSDAVYQWKMEQKPEVLFTVAQNSSVDLTNANSSHKWHLFVFDHLVVSTYIAYVHKIWMGVWDSLVFRQMFQIIFESERKKNKCFHIYWAIPRDRVDSYGFISTFQAMQSFGISVDACALIRAAKVVNVLTQDKIEILQIGIEQKKSLRASI